MSEKRFDERHDTSPNAGLRSDQGTRQRLNGYVLFGLSLIMLGVVVIAQIPDLFARLLLGLGVGLAVAACVVLIQLIVRPNISWHFRVTDSVVLLLFLAAETLLVVSGSISDHITFSPSRLTCGSGLDPFSVNKGEGLLLSWRNAGVNTYCRIEGPHPARGVNRLVVHVSNLDLRGSQPSLKIDAEVMHLPLADPSDADTSLVDAPWARLRSGNISFVLPEKVVQGNSISYFTLTFHGLRDGSLQVMMFFRPSPLERMVAGNWPLMLTIALATTIGLVVVARVRTRNTRHAVSHKLGDLSKP